MAGPSLAYDRGDPKDTEWLVEHIIQGVDDSPEPWNVA